jgi:hypothetical protein
VISNGTAARRLTGDPDRVPRSPGRCAFAVIAAFVIAVGTPSALFGAFASLDAGEQRDWFRVVTGIQLAAFGTTSTSPPRGRRDQRRVK